MSMTGDVGLPREDLVFFGVSDLGGHFRGKGFPRADLEERLDKGVGMTGSNIMMSAFGPIYESPFGTEGDTVMAADRTTAVEVAFGPASPAERFYICDLRTTEGAPWSCCPRTFMRRAVDALRTEFGIELLAAFEQEFVLPADGGRTGTSYGYDSFRRAAGFGEAFTAALRAAGTTPDSFLPEYAPAQFEVTVAPTLGLRAADEAVIVREMARAVAARMGQRVSFAPLMEVDGVGNGTHVHFSLRDLAGQPAMHDPLRPHGLSDLGEHFVAGIQAHIRALAAVTAPSVASYYRLRPNRWAPTWNNVGYRDRGASLRICPVFRSDRESAARQFNVEYRVADATACPHLVLGGLMHAGLDGLRRKLRLSPAPREGVWSLSDAEREQAGFRALPRRLEDALDLLAATPEAADWFGKEFLDVYLSFKRAEARVVAGLPEEEVIRRYVEVY